MQRCRLDEHNNTVMSWFLIIFAASVLDDFLELARAFEWIIFVASRSRATFLNTDHPYPFKEICACAKIHPCRNHCTMRDARAFGSLNPSPIWNIIQLLNAVLLKLQVDRAKFGH